MTKLADLVALAELEPRQHRHLAHLLNCLRQTNSPQELLSLYLSNNPIQDEKLGPNLKADVAYLERNLRKGGSTGNYYFLDGLALKLLTLIF